MAYVLTNLNYDKISLGKDLEELKIKTPRWEMYELGIAGHIVEISDSDFKLIQTGRQTVNDCPGGKANFKVGTFRALENAEQVKEVIDEILSFVNLGLKKYENTPFKQEIENYKNNLESINTSSISYPLNMTVEEYLLSQNKTILAIAQVE